jgi:hypothetical protein
MAKVSAKGGKGFKVATRTPSSAFVLGSRPGNLRAGGAQRIKPAAASTTQYGKMDQTGQGDTDTMGGLS